MSELTSTKPYLLRAILEWCVDNGLTPHLLVVVNGETRVPMAYVKDGEIVLNLNYSATKDLLIENTHITFSARFSGVSQNLYIPMSAVKGVFARENGQGMFFEVEKQMPEIRQKLSEVIENDLSNQLDGKSKSNNHKKPTLKIVK